MKKGFTIIELLASIGIMGLILIISIPAYNGISDTIKQQNYNSKMSMMEKSTIAYINKYHKDKLFNGSSTPACYSLQYLISKNVFSPDNKTDDGMTDPINGGNLKGYLKAYYNITSYEVDIEYIDTILTTTTTGCSGGIHL